MRKCVWSLALLFFTEISFAQPQNKGFFVVKGKVENAQQLNSLDCSLSCYVSTRGQKEVVIPVSEDGTFEQKIEIEGTQLFYIPLANDFAEVYTQPNDTITINYDNNNLAESLHLIGNTTKRSGELNFDYQFLKEFYPKQAALAQRLSNEKDQPDSVKVSWVNDEYNQEFKYILTNKNLDEKERDLRIHDSYFKLMYEMCIRVFLNRMPEFLKYDLIYGSENIVVKDISYTNIPDYRKMGLSLFYNSSNYRNFIALFTELYYVGKYPPKPYLAIMDYRKLPDSAWNNNNLEKNYYLAMASLGYYPIRDWYITTKIIEAFNRQNQFQTFEQTEKVMMDFLPVCQNQEYKDSLLAVYNRSKKHVPGKPAPDFTLQDENGKKVSLSAFKGKVVVLDFWGVHCGPCIADLQNTVPKVHEKYKGDNVVFINICVEDTEDNWKDAIRKYNVQGVNLFAKGWSENQVCKEYGIEGIPRYILIDQNGNYIDNNSSAYVLLWKDNILDKNLDK